jgi:hypothetical protein
VTRSRWAEEVHLQQHDAVLATQRFEQYKAALGSRSIIGQANGLNRERYDLDAVAGSLC